MTGPAPSAEQILDHLSSGRRPWLLLVLLCLSLYLPGIAALPPVDRDEARYVQATKQMLESGDYIRIRFQDEARNKKPAGVYWLQAAVVTALGGEHAVGIWAYRLVSVAGATLAVLMTFGFGAAIFDRRAGLVGAALLAATADLVFEAHVATTDAVLLPAAVAAQGALALAYLGRRRGEDLSAGVAAAFWLAQGIALMIKGPVVPLLSAVTALALVVADRRAGWLKALRPLWGPAVTLALVAPWFWLIQHDTGGAFLRDSVGRDFIGKIFGGQEAHGAPPGYYLALLPATFWPASLFLGLTAIWAWRSRRLPASRFVTAWVLPFWVILELVPTKLPHYVLPLYPALALGAGRALLSFGEDGLGRVPRWLRVAVPALWAIVAAGLGLGLALLPILVGEAPLAAGAVAMAAAGAAIWQVLVRDRGRTRLEAVPALILSALALFAASFQFLLPFIDPIWLSRSADRLIAGERQGQERIAVAGYAEPSLVFLEGTDTRLVVASEAARSLATGEAGLALVSGDQEAGFRQALADRGAAVRDLGAVNGFDYSNGKWLTLRLYRLALQN